MKRILAATVLAIGLLPSMPLALAGARSLNQEDLTRHCRDRLGFGQTEPLYDLDLLQLRRCIDNTRDQFEYADRLERRMGVPAEPIRYDQAQTVPVTVPHETRRSLNDRVTSVGKSRVQYYKETPVDIRDYALQQHRTSRRLAVQEQEQRIILERHEKKLRWQRAIQVCRYVTRNQQLECVQVELAK